MSQFILALLGEQYVSPLILRFDLIFRSERSFFVQIPHCGFEKYLFERWNKQMTESKVFTDNFSRSFTESGDFFQFLSDRKARSKWMTAPSRELQFEPVERGSTLGNLYMQIYDHNGAAEILEDTMENTSLLLKVDGKDYPVRSCALKTVLERARISGHALNKVSKSVFAEILNYCMGVASGDSLIKVADEKVSAVHGGDPKDYTVMEMLPLFKATNDFLDREYPGNRFMTAHFDHSIATAIWCLDGQADKLLDTYHREIAAKGLQTEKMVPALRFSTSDVGMSGANLYPIFLVGAESRIVPLGYSIRTEHKNGVDMQYFEEQLRLVYAQFEKALDKQVQLMNIEIRYPVTTLMRVLKRIKAPKKASYERALEELDSIGVKRINVMVDSDYQVKEEVRKARDRYIEMGAAAGFEMAPITWTQKQKGVDDLYKHLFRDK